MLTNNNFLLNLNILKENFEFTISDIYCRLVFDSLKDKITDRIFIETCKGILQTTTKEDWNKAYGYRGRPAVADWIKAFVPEMQKKRIYKKCPNTGVNFIETGYEYPDWYLKEINNKLLN